MDEDEQVQPQEPQSRNSEKVSEAGAGPRDALDTFGMHEPCYWNDKKYSDGASVCESHIRYECWNGKWVEIGQC
jgi:hypothetical protein